MSVIEDGKGSGKKAYVDDENHLVTHAYTEQFKEFALLTGDAFNINTGIINLTSDSATPVLYIENKGVGDFVIPTITYILRASTGGSGDLIVNVYKNITGGTIISNATDVEMKNSRNVGLSKTPVGNIYKGATGDTRIGGEKIISTITGAESRVVIEPGDTIIPRFKNICFEIIPPTGNTSMNIMCITELWIRS
jgi:hypothetical protein